MKKINNMKTVTITTRAVYHKIAEVTLEVPENINEDEIQDWIENNERLHVEELDARLQLAPLEYGFGLGFAFEEQESAWETRYDFCVDGKIVHGGHC